jgi:amino-acid N-acetyltransferase
MNAPEDPTGWTVRAATEADQPAIRALVRSEKLNPTMLHWPTFVVAVTGPEIVGAAQIRRHEDGSRELGSIVVAPRYRGRGIAGRLVLTLLASETGPVHVVTARARAERYRRFGFREIRPDQAPRRVRRNLRLGAFFGSAHSLLHGRLPIPLAILERSPPEVGDGVRSTTGVSTGRSR